MRSFAVATTTATGGSSASWRTLSGPRTLAAIEAGKTIALANKEVVREMTRVETGLATRGYLRDHSRWTQEFARRYFATTSAALREADENHLVLGCRFRSPVGADVLARCVYPAVDVALPVEESVEVVPAPVRVAA